MFNKRLIKLIETYANYIKATVEMIKIVQVKITLSCSTQIMLFSFGQGFFWPTEVS
jgi:hypothetical protein